MKRYDRYLRLTEATYIFRDDLCNPRAKRVRQVNTMKSLRRIGMEENRACNI